ncbi:hypothetical protein ACFQX7_29590 [Luedemannella flava]
MGGVVAIGEAQLVADFALAGVAVHVADSPADAVAAWRALADSTALVILSPTAAQAIGPTSPGPGRPVVAVLPADPSRPDPS